MTCVLLKSWLQMVNEWMSEVWLEGKWKEEAVWALRNDVMFLPLPRPPQSIKHLQNRCPIEWPDLENSVSGICQPYITKLPSDYSTLELFPHQVIKLCDIPSPTLTPLFTRGFVRGTRSPVMCLALQVSGVNLSTGLGDRRGGRNLCMCLWIALSAREESNS